MKSGNVEKGRLGPDSCLGQGYEKQLVEYINKFIEYGFAPTNLDIRSMAFEFVEKFKIPHKFNCGSKRAGHDWLKSFLERNPELYVRQPEELSLTNCQEENETGEFFTLLEQLLIENDLLNEPSKIFNMDMSCLRVNEVNEENSKELIALTPKEKGEHITVIACCSADGKYIPPAVILKEIHKNTDFNDALPPGNDVYVSNHSSYISAELLFKWFRNQFIPNKPDGKILLILNGNSIHCSIDVLETATENDIILLCLPNHSKQEIQPLKALFDSLKTCYGHEANCWLRRNPNKTLNQLQVGKLLGKAWQRAATAGNVISGFEVCGIYPLNPYLIPDHFLAPLIMSQ